MGQGVEDSDENVGGAVNLTALGTAAAGVGLNWKSLSTPAVLPLTTDYVPTDAELKSIRYSQRPESVTFEPQTVADKSHLQLLNEMVTMRLTYDFQLVNEEGLAFDFQLLQVGQWVVLCVSCFYFYNFSFVSSLSLSLSRMCLINYNIFLSLSFFSSVSL